MTKAREVADLATAIPASEITGVLPAIDGSALTGLDSPIKAWVNFNGTGVVAIRASSNVSSITDLGTGTYRINFATDMPDADYAVNLSGNNTSSYGYSFSVPANGAVPAVGSIDVVAAAGAAGTAGADLNYVYVSIFR